MINDRKYAEHFRWAGRAFATLVLALGVIGLAGWILDEPRLRSLWKTGSEMKFNTAVCHALLGGALLLAFWPARAARWISFSASTGVLVITLLTLAEYVSGRSLGIDELFYRDPSLRGTTFPGRMAAQSATSFILLAGANILLAYPYTRQRLIGQWGALAALIFPVQALMGYLLGRMTIVGLNPQSSYMAIPTALAFASGAVALLLRQPGNYLMEALTARTQASMVFRRLLLTSLFLPLVLGWVALNLAGGYAQPPEYSVATVALATTFLFVALTWFHAARVNGISLSLARRDRLLRETEDRYRLLFDSIDEGFCVIKLICRHDRVVDYRFLEVNPAFEKLTGLSAAKGKRMLELVPDHEEHWFEIYGRVAATGEPARFQNEARALNRWYDVYAFRFGDPLKRQVAVLFNDITLIKRNQAELQDAKARLETTLAATEVATWIWDVANDRVFADKNLARFFAVSPEDAAGGSVEKYIRSIHPDDRAPVKTAISQAMQSGAGSYEVDYRLVHPDGSVRWVTARGRAERDAEGRTVRFPGVIIDITERKKAEAILRQNEGLFSALVEQAPTGVYVVDAQFRLQQINALAMPAFAQVEPKIGRDFGEVMTILWGPEVGGSLAAIFRHTLVTGEPYMAPAFAGFREDLAEERAYEWQIKRVTLPDGSHGVVCYFNDITERIRSEGALLRAKAGAEAANRSKDQFLAALSHELRTPLNPALLIASEGSDNHELPEAVRQKFETIQKYIELEARLIDDLLDLTRITTGKMVLDRRPVDVHLILRDALATVQADQQEKNLQLTVNLAAPHSLVNGDAVRLQQVFWNVLKNSVKFTPKEGRITVETHLESDHRLAVVITDTGIGMNADEVARVFNAFAQGDHADGGGSHRFGGLGLGLAISKNLVELQAGTITAQSAGHELGSVFTIGLPLLSEPGASPAIALEAGRKQGADSGLNEPFHLSLLLVEDHEITRTILAQLLVRRNYRVVTADSVAQARALAAVETFDILISDIGLPDGNGNDLMSELRDRYGLKGIALTGYGMEEDIARGKAAGFLAHLIKPVSIKALETALTLFRKSR